MTLSELRRVLDERGIQLTKSLGQNFLHDANQLRRIVQAAELSAADRVLEIGPGLGALTDLLLAGAAEVFAIEKDARLVAELQRRFASEPGVSGHCPEITNDELPLLPRGRRGPTRGGHSVNSSTPSPPLGAGERESAGGSTRMHPSEPRLRLLHADALAFLQNEARDWRDWKLVSNLPYSVASPILVELALQPHPPGRIVATLQLEVARRLMAGAGDDDYGILSLLVQLRYEPRGLFKVPAGCFFPEPDVASACVTLVRRERELLPAELRGPFARVVKLAFSQRRKMMLKLLKQQWPADKLEAAFAALGILPQARAESLGLEQFVELTRRLRS